VQADLAALLALAEETILPRPLSERAKSLEPALHSRLRVGADLGTAYLVLVVLDDGGRPLAGEWQFTEVVRDGLVVDFVGAADLLRDMKSTPGAPARSSADLGLQRLPAGVPQAEVRAIANVVEAAGLHCSGLVDEPTAANLVLQLPDGAIVDVGGGTTASPSCATAAWLQQPTSPRAGRTSRWW